MIGDRLGRISTGWIKARNAFRKPLRGLSSSCWPAVEPVDIVGGVTDGTNTFSVGKFSSSSESAYDAIENGSWMFLGSGAFQPCRIDLLRKEPPAHRKEFDAVACLDAE